VPIFYFLIFCVCFLLPAYAGNDKMSRMLGFVPGTSETERWEWVKNHIEVLSKADKDTVDKILPTNVNPKVTPDSYELRIADASDKAEAGNQDYYAFVISFDAKRKVDSVEVRHVHFSRFPALSRQDN
jgi:hypothetical protein